jgi:hypothetical protein
MLASVLIRMPILAQQRWANAMILQITISIPVQYTGADDMLGRLTVPAQQRWAGTEQEL